MPEKPIVRKLVRWEADGPGKPVAVAELIIGVALYLRDAETGKRIRIPMDGTRWNPVDDDGNIMDAVIRIGIVARRTALTAPTTLRNALYPGFVWLKGLSGELRRRGIAHDLDGDGGYGYVDTVLI